METEEPLGARPDGLRRQYDGGLLIESMKPVPGGFELDRIELAVSRSAVKTRKALGPCRPPDQALSIPTEKVHHGRRASLRHEERNHRRAVPEPQRPLRRSSMRASTVLSPGSRTGETLRRSWESFPEGARTTPARINLSNRSLARSTAWAGIRRAIGRPRSVTCTSSPFLTPTRYAEREAFNSETEALFI